MLSISEWGPKAWVYLHTLAFSYPPAPTRDQRKDMHAFLVAFARTLPCPKCSAHFQQVVHRDLPTHDADVLSCRHNFARWTVDVHNEVNARLGKPEREHKSVEGEYDVTDASLCRAKPPSPLSGPASAAQAALDALRGVVSSATTKAAVGEGAPEKEGSGGCGLSIAATIGISVGAAAVCLAVAGGGVYAARRTTRRLSAAS